MGSSKEDIMVLILKRWFQDEFTDGQLLDELQSMKRNWTGRGDRRGYVSEYFEEAARM